jgi:hypothetical protein
VVALGWLLAGCIGRAAGESAPAPDARAPVVMAPPDATAAGPLVDLRVWTVAPPELDPFAEHLADSVPCENADWHREPTAIEVETKSCNYLTLMQPALRDLRAGDRLWFLAWWQRLLSEQPAIGHMAVALGKQVVWQESVMIPGEADAREVLLTGVPELHRGDPVFVHVRNHGYNSWKFSALMVR